jgi:ElaB/YqjD/DUF883 family membrane-anchored ribosome-binding protein
MRNLPNACGRSDNLAKCSPRGGIESTAPSTKEFQSFGTARAYVYLSMPNDTTNAFPQTRNDVSNLKETAKDAAKDLASTASTHVNKARGQVQDLAAHAQSEAQDQMGQVRDKVADQVGQVRDKVADLADTARDYVLARPLTCLSVALAIGFVFGLSRRGSRD